MVTSQEQVMTYVAKAKVQSPILKKKHVPKAAGMHSTGSYLTAAVYMCHHFLFAFYFQPDKQLFF